ncbi:MAG: MBL fold metallo-hydrolase [bacterium]|nr:MBL fold metallo-hydrolase [bacterium]
MNKIKFLGTAGARFVVTRQLRASGGIWFELDDTRFLLDPGPGSLVKCFSSRPKKDPFTLDAIILSHRHIDHSSDLNIMVEAMTNGGFKKRGSVFLPPDAVEKEPIFFKYLYPAIDELVIYEEKSRYKIKNIDILTSRKLIHPVETCGFEFKFSKGSIGYVADTRFFNELVNEFKSDVLIINTVRYDHDPDSSKIIDHLTFNEAIHLIKEIKPKLAVLTHFGMTMLKNKPHELAEKASRQTDIKVICASDGLEIDLDKIL